MCMRIPGVLAPEKVAVVAGITTGSLRGTRMLHAVNAEHCPRKREATAVKNILPKGYHPTCAHSTAELPKLCFP